ncbi:MAG: four helix bundle protein [Patescibacteria group bacterium]|nr:four helix bundle protein [Patescibacteria group bacterium]
MNKDIENRKITSFTDLIVWRKGHELVVMIYNYLSKGSLLELENFILIAKDVGYLSDEDFKSLVEKARTVDQLLQGFIRKSKTFIVT